MKYAKDFKCSNCNNQAKVFFGMADPDCEQLPYCEKCVEEMKMRIYRKLNEVEE